MSIHAPEFATRVGCLDDSAFADGRPVDSFLLREIARSTNRLLQMGDPLVVLPFNANQHSGWEEFPEVVRGHATTKVWSRLLPIGPIYAPKKSTHSTFEAQVVMYVANDATIWMQFATDSAPFDPAATSNSQNTIECRGTGTYWQTFTKTGLSCGDGPAANVEIWIRSDAQQTAVNTTTYGTPNTGTALFSALDKLKDVGAAWHTYGAGSTLDDGTVSIAFTRPTASDELLAPVQEVSAVISSTELQFYPGLTGMQFRAFRGGGAVYSLYHSGAEYRVAGISCYTEAL